MAKWQGEIKNMLDVCGKCPCIDMYRQGQLTIEQAREMCGEKCARKKNTEQDFIFKFDIVLSLHEHKRRKEFKGQGRQPVAEKRYGKAARTLKDDGKSVAQIAEILNISRPTVYKLLAAPTQEDKEE